MKITLLLLLSTTLFLSAGKEKHGKNYKKALKVLNGFCSYVPSGAMVLADDTTRVQAFFMSKTEITNLQYREFLHYLKQHNRIDEWQAAQVDSSRWSTSNSMNSKFETYYHGHPAYNNHPVVNITRENAEAYCEWLSMMYDSISMGEMKIKFRIPTHAEYIRAARGDNHMWVYPWGGRYLQNTKGQVLCNFLRLDATNISHSETGYEVKILPNYGMASVYDILAPAKSYWPNEFGLYNLSGNCGEIISDKDIVVGGNWSSPGYDVRIESEIPYTGASPKTGFRVVASLLN